MRNKYSISEFIKTAYSLLITKMIYPKARIIRRPVYFRGGGYHLLAPKDLQPVGFADLIWKGKNRLSI